MISDILQADRAGGVSYPTADPGQGFCKRLLGADAPRGSVVLPAWDDGQPGFDSQQAVGEGGVSMSVMLPDAAVQAEYERVGLFQIVNGDDDIALQNSDPECVSGHRMVKCRLTVAGGENPLNGWMVDWANPGLLIPHDGTGKCIALNAAAIDPALTGEQLVWCYFDGARGWG